MKLKPEEMLAYGLTINDVDTAMRSGYLPEPVGSIEEGNRDYTVRFRKDIDSIHDVGRIVVADRGNVSLRLQDIADISIRYTLPSQALVIDGQTAIRINASPKDGGNIRQMTQDILSILNHARDAGVLPADTELQLYVDPAEYINNSIRNVVRSALLGAALAMSIVLLALGEFRNTLLIGISLPLTLVLSFILLSVFDVSLNLISLGGIALAVGMVIDSSIVVMENIHRHYEEADEVPDRRALQKLIVAAVAQVRSPVIASTVTTILVFLPISFTAPLTNAILGDQANAVVFALVFALLVALTVLPVIALSVYRPKPGNGGASVRKRGLARLSGGGMNLLANLYRSSLRAVIRKKWRASLLILFSFGVLAFALTVIVPLIPKEIISPPSSDRIVVFFRSTGTTDRLEIVETIVPQLERTVAETAGDAVLDTYALVSGRFNILFILLRDSHTAEAVLGDLQRAFVSDSDFYFNVNMWDPAQLPLPRTNDLQLGVRGEDETQIVTIMEEIRDLVNESGYYARVYTDPPTGLSDELSMTARTEVIDGFSQYSANTLIALVRRILRGTSAIEFEESQQTVSVSAVFPEETLAGRERLENFLIPTSKGIVPLKHFFDFQDATSVAGIASENGERIFRVYARMPSGSPAADRPRYEAEIRRLLDEKLTLPPGYSVVVENSPGRAGRGDPVPVPGTGRLGGPHLPCGSLPVQFAAHSAGNPGDGPARLHRRGRESVPLSFHAEPQLDARNHSACRDRGEQRDHPDRLLPPDGGRLPGPDRCAGGDRRTAVPADPDHHAHDHPRNAAPRNRTRRGLEHRPAAGNRRFGRPPHLHPVHALRGARHPELHAEAGTFRPSVAASTFYVAIPLQTTLFAVFWVYSTIFGMEADAMKIGCVKEIKKHEYRVGLTPSCVTTYTAHGHEVFLETGAGIEAGFEDSEYREAGARIEADAKTIFDRCDMIVKVKEPQPSEYPLFRKGQILFTYLHLAADEKQTRALLESGIKAVAYETIRLADGTLPCLRPMSEIAGRLSVQEGAKYLEKPFGGRGILLGGVPGVRRGRVGIVGGGVVGFNAAKMAVGLGADVTLLDVNPNRLAYIDDVFHGQVGTLFSTEANLVQVLAESRPRDRGRPDPGSQGTPLIRRSHLQLMKKRSVIVDVAVDQGGCVETTRPTTHDDPVYTVDGVVHYCVANMPGAVALTSTLALTSSTLPYGLKIADKGLEEACRKHPDLKEGLNIYQGKCTYADIASAFGLEYVPADTVL